MDINKLTDIIRKEIIRQAGDDEFENPWIDPRSENSFFHIDGHINLELIAKAIKDHG